MTDAAIQVAVVVVYMVGLLVLGAVASRRVKDSRDYFVANKQLGFLATAFSARATGESAWLLLGLTGLGAAVFASVLLASRLPHAQLVVRGGAS